MFGSEPSEIDYPENLKSSLIALQGVVDVVIPGLGAASVESDLVQEPMFIDSQDDLGEVAHLSSANLNSYKLSTPRPPSSRRHATPTPTPTPLAVTSPSSINRASSESASKKSRDESRRDKSKSTPPRPRHDDSQIEFTAIGSTRLPSHESDATSAVMDVAGNVLFGDESQVLTERQLEVRDRQRETNALYSDAMSSSPSGNAAARRLAARSTDPNASLSKEDVHSTSEQAAREQEKQEAHQPARRLFCRNRCARQRQSLRLETATRITAAIFHLRTTTSSHPRRHRVAGRLSCFLLLTTTRSIRRRRRQSRDGILCCLRWPRGPEAAAFWTSGSSRHRHYLARPLQLTTLRPSPS